MPAANRCHEQMHASARSCLLIAAARGERLGRGATGHAVSPTCHALASRLTFSLDGTPGVQQEEVYIREGLREEDGSEGKANTTATEEEDEELHAVEPLLPFRLPPSTVSLVNHLAELLITQDHGPILPSKDGARARV